MYFVLPGNDGAPVETLRSEALRFAVQDYELLRLAAAALPPEAFQPLLERALGRILRSRSLSDFAQVGSASATSLYSLEPGDYRRAQEEMLKNL
jgi:hypothetical protein